MRSLFLAALIALPAHADYIAKEGGASVRITESPCPAEVLKHIPEGQRGYWRAAHSIIGDRSYRACWALNGRYVLLQYADGDEGILTVEMFTKSPGV